MNQTKPKNKAVGWILFIIYLVILTYLLFFAESFGRSEHSSDTLHYNLTLFKEIKRFYKYRYVLGLDVFFLNTIGNIVAFIPFGFFIPIIGKRKHNFLRTVLAGALFSLAVETVQLVCYVGSFDVDDIFLNTIGSIIGYIIFLIMKIKVWNKKSRKNKNV